MQAFLNNPTLKKQLLVQIRKHEKADQIVKGHYGEMNGKFTGCAIGCALHSLNLIQHKGKRDRETQLRGIKQHDRFPTELGIPIELAYLIDHFFESLPEAQSQTFPRHVIEAIAPGADLAGVMPALLQWSILDPIYGWRTYAKTPDQIAVVERFAATVARDWRGDTVANLEWDQLTQDLTNSFPEWAWARAWGRGRGRARAWAGAWAGPDWYVAASDELLRLLREAQ